LGLPCATYNFAILMLDEFKYRACCMDIIHKTTPCCDFLLISPFVKVLLLLLLLL